MGEGSPSHPKGYVDAHYLFNAAIRATALKQRSYDMMRLQAGQTVLDVGCGPGVDTLALGTCVGPEGSVIGVDHDAAMIAIADQRAARAGVSHRVRHLVADAVELPLPAGSVDACRCERVLQHVPRPERVIAEMVRVTKPGGSLVAIDLDYGTMSVDTPEIDVERRLVRFGAEHCVNSGYAGRRLWKMFRQHCLDDVGIAVHATYETDYAAFRISACSDIVEREALAAGIVSADELHRFQASVAEADRDGSFFCTVSIVMVGGRIPIV